MAAVLHRPGLPLCKGRGPDGVLLEDALCLEKSSATGDTDCKICCGWGAGVPYLEVHYLFAATN